MNEHKCYRQKGKKWREMKKVLSLSLSPSSPHACFTAFSSHSPSSFFLSLLSFSLLFLSIENLSPCFSILFHLSLSSIFLSFRVSITRGSYLSSTQSTSFRSRAKSKASLDSSFSLSFLYFSLPIPLRIFGIIIIFLSLISPSSSSSFFLLVSLLFVSFLPHSNHFFFLASSPNLNRFSFSLLPRLPFSFTARREIRLEQEGKESRQLVRFTENTLSERERTFKSIHFEVCQEKEEKFKKK